MRHPTTGTEPLPFSIWPAETYPLEPIQGWIHRAAERNYAFSTDTFVASLGLSARDWDYDELLKIVRQLPIDSHADLEHCTPKRCSEGYDICGHKVPFRFISKSERRVCPQCLDEGRYIRTWFDFVPVATCPHHNVALVGGLPNDPVDWRHTEIGWTRSGVKVGAEHATPQIASELDHYLVGALSGTRLSEPDHLIGVSLDAILTASICLGRLFRGNEKHPSTTENVRQFCQLGFEPLFRGVDAVIEFLRRAEWLQPGYDRGRYKSRCDGVPKMLPAIRDENLRHLITDSFARARVRNGVTTPAGRLSKYDGEDDLLNLKGAARRLGLSTYALQELLRKLAIESKRCKHTRARRLTHEQLVSVRNYIEEALSSDDAARLLGCTPQDLRSLVARRLLRSAFSMAGRYHYTKSDLHAFVDAMASASVNYPPQGGQLIQPCAKQMEISLAEACSLILRDKSLVVVEHDPRLPLFRGLKVADAAIASGQASSNGIRRTRIRPNAQVRDAITFAEAAARLGTGYDGIKGLIKASLIRIAKDSGDKNRICGKSLELFESRYVKASAYAPILNCHPTCALKILRMKGVIPINDWETAGPRFVDRQEVLRLAGLDCPKVTAFAGWQAMKEELDEHLAAHALPATTRISSAPGIEVRATSGRWSFLIKREQDKGQYSLTSSFTFIRQRGRLKKVQEASIEPSEIWPGASVYSADGGGFVIVDEALEPQQDGSNEDALIDRVITRACQIHRVL